VILLALLIGLLLILWGVFILYSAFFRMTKEDYKDKGVLGVSGYIEFEVLFRLLSKLPTGLIKVIVILIGFALIVLGIVIIL
jgi:uncharacterized membrane protein HdeD (DUF308 family)